MQQEDEFHALLAPTLIDGQHFIGRSLPLDSPAIFGGQLMAQVLSAAAATLQTPRSAHYLQCDFVAPGDPQGELEFDVTCVRDGRSTSHRTVTVSQQGRTLLLASLSFQDPAPGYDHQVAVPEVQQPETLLSDPANVFSFSDNDDEQFPFVMLSCPASSAAAQPRSDIWARSRSPVTADEHRQQQLLAFLSDATILQSALNPHQLDWEEPGLVVATMNHSIWFHRPLDVNEWFLLHSESPSTGSGRAFSTANIFDHAGTLAATVAQEGILRKRSL